MRKVVDNKGRLFGLVSIIDVVVAAVVIVLAIAVFTKFNASETPLGTSNTVEVAFTIKIPRLRESNASLLHIGDKLYTADIGAYIGTIREINIQDAYTVEPIIDGTYVKARVYERFDVILTVDALCSHSNGRYYVDRTFELNANNELWMSTKYNDIRGTILTITAE